MYEYLLELGSNISFLPNGNLILVTSSDHQHYKKIYKYSLINKPTNETPLEYSQIYYVKSLDKFYADDLFVYQTKLFLFKDGLMTQWDLSTMTLKRKYNLVD